MRTGDGSLVYALDDAYIHLAVAKNAVAHGVWGVTPAGFTSSTSSIVWPGLLVAGFEVLGPVVWLPLVLNLLAGALLLVAVQRVLDRGPVRPSPRVAFAGLCAVAFLTGLPAVILTGLEHVLHAWLVLVFCFAAARQLASDEPPGPRRGLALVGLAALLPLVRFESMATVLLVAALQLLRGRRRAALGYAAAAVVGVLAYGLVSRSQGWWWLPNSVLLKGSRPRVEGLGDLVSLFGGQALDHALRAPDLLVLLVACAALSVRRWSRSRGLWETRQLATVLFLGTALFQLQFAKTGNLYRYDLYLVVLGGVILLSHGVEALTLGHVRMPDRRSAPRWLVGTGLAACAALPFVVQRGLGGLVNGPRACANTYRQMVQVGRFLHRYHADDAVAVNDIGAVCWIGEPDLVDLAGLATMEIARLRRARAYTPEAMHDACAARGVRVAVAYPGWYGKPPAWTPVAAWEVPTDVAVGSRRVTFYATDPAGADALADELREFEPELPRGVRSTLFVDPP